MLWVRRYAVWLATGLVAVVAGHAFGDPPKIRGESQRTAQRFAAAAEIEQARYWPQVIDHYLQLIDDAGDDLAPLDGKPNELLAVRFLVQRRLAGRPELLTAYRERVEPQARRLLELGASRRDESALEQLVDRYYCSRSAEAALQLLGDLACERGDFARARQYWRQLTPGAAPGDLCYPDPIAGPALPKAKLILLRLLSGEKVEAATELRAFQTVHADAVGRLAGRDGNLVATLQTLLDSAENMRVPLSPGGTTTFATFAGDAARNGVLPGPLPPLHSKLPFSAISLPGSPSRVRAASSLEVRNSDWAVHPIVVQGQVFVSDETSVLAFDLSTGRLSVRFEGASGPGSAKRPRNDTAGYSLTFDGDRIYACLGPRTAPGAARDPSNVLVCLQWRPEQESENARLRLLWRLPAKSEGEFSGTWDGPPLVRDGKVFASTTRRENSRCVSTLLCIDDQNPNAGPLWRKEIVESSGDGVGEGDRLLTLAGRHVVHCSHTGVVTALEAATGRRAWAFRYATHVISSVRNEARARQRLPCVFAGERIFVAPADADRVFCLNAESGSLIWSGESIGSPQILGVARGRIVCAFTGFHSGLCAFDVGTGVRISDWGYRVAGNDPLAPLGRGLVCDDRVYWPTRGLGVQELRSDGSVGYAPTMLRDLPGGNLAFGDGRLIVATHEKLYVIESADAAAHGKVGRHEIK